jgi:neutral ceramidase
MHRSVSVEARRLIERTTGIPPTHVTISATHTHSAVSALGTNRFEADVPLDEYQRFVAHRIAEGVQCAAKYLRPARVGFGTVLAPEYPKNRRWFMQVGSNSLINPFGTRSW